MLSGALPGVFPAALNHLLAGEAWAHARLKPFAGQTVRLEAPPLPALDLTITAEGGFTAAERDASAAGATKTALRARRSELRQRLGS